MGGRREVCLGGRTHSRYLAPHRSFLPRQREGEARCAYHSSSCDTPGRIEGDDKVSHQGRFPTATPVVAGGALQRLVASNAHDHSCQEATMIQLITQQSYGDFPEALAEMHRLRYRVFKGRLDWDV